MIRPKPKKGGRVSPDTEEIPGRVDTGVGGSNNAQILPAAHPEVACKRGKVQQRRLKFSRYEFKILKDNSKYS